MARKMKRFAQGGDAYQTARRARKEADIESDYQKALKAGKNAQIALAKKEQRMADAADDFAKWTRSDRTQTRAAERAAEMALSQARRTQGRSIADRDLGSRINPTPEKPMDLSGIKTDLSSVKTPSVTPTRRAAAAPARRTAPQPPAPTSRPGSGVTLSGEALRKRQEEEAGRDALRRLMSRSMVPGSAPEELRGRARYPVRNVIPEPRQVTDPAEFRRAVNEADPDFKVYPPFGTGDMRAKGGSIKKKPVVKKAKGGVAKKPVKKYAKGGSIDGCAVRGKTRAKRTK